MKHSFVNYISKKQKENCSKLKLTLLLVMIALCAMTPNKAWAQNETTIKMKTEAPIGTKLRIYTQPFNEANISGGVKKTDFYGEYEVVDPTKEIVITGNLTQLECYKCQLTELIADAPKLQILKCYENKLSNLDINKCITLNTVDCHNNDLSALDVSMNEKLEKLVVYQNKLTTLTIGSANKALKRLECGNNLLTKLDVSNCTALADLYAEQNLLTTLDLSKNTSLWWIKVYSNKIEGQGMDNFINNLPHPAQAPPMLYIVNTRNKNEGNKCYVKDVEAAKAKGWIMCDWLDGTDNGSMIGGTYNGIDYVPEVSKHNIVFTTTKQIGEKIKLEIKAIGDAEILIDGVAESTPFAGKQTLTLTKQNVTIKGDVGELTCSGNNITEFSSDDGNPITYLDCSNNEIKTLVLKNHSALLQLHCQQNKLETLDLTGSNGLYRVNCYRNALIGSKMTAMVNSLYDGKANKPLLYIIDTQAPAGTEKNVALKSDVVIAKNKSWTIKDYINGGMYGMGKTYDGSEPTYLTVTIEAAENGKITVDEGIDLTKVIYGTELTFNVVPENGYELAELKANKTDITATKTAIIKEDTKITAKFEQIKKGDAYFKISRPEKGVAMITIETTTPATAPFIEGAKLSGWNGASLTLNLTEETATIYTELIKLQALYAQLSHIDVTHELKLTELMCGLNQIKEIDLSKNEALQTFSGEINQFEMIDFSACKDLSYVNCYGNNIKRENMTNMINNLPDRKGRSTGMLIIVDTTLGIEKNDCTKAQVNLAHKRNWQVYDLNGDPEKMKVYKGSDATGIQETQHDKTVVSKVYYNQYGIKTNAPHKGINIIKTKYADGTEDIRKEIRK